MSTASAPERCSDCEYWSGEDCEKGITEDEVCREETELSPILVQLICVTCGKAFDMPVQYAYIQTHRDKTLRPLRWCWECVQKMWKGETNADQEPSR